jgi:hypothetical protein
VLRRSYLKTLARASVVVHTGDGRSVQGVLVGEYRDALVLRHAVYLIPDGRREQLDGDVAIPRRNVSFLQVSPAPIDTAG